MDELKKIRRVSEKAMAGAPHETWMVLDATNGQNAISQAKTFKAEMEITGAEPQPGCTSCQALLVASRESQAAR